MKPKETYGVIVNVKSKPYKPWVGVARKGQDVPWLTNLKDNGQVFGFLIERK